VTASIAHEDRRTQEVKTQRTIQIAENVLEDLIWAIVGIPETFQINNQHIIVKLDHGELTTFQ